MFFKNRRKELNKRYEQFLKIRELQEDVNFIYEDYQDEIAELKARISELEKSQTNAPIELYICRDDR